MAEVVGSKLKVPSLQVGTSTTAGWILTADASGNASWAAAPAGSVTVFSASIPFTDGDTMRRVTIANGAVTSASKISGQIVRPSSADDSLDEGYIYLHNIVERTAGSFDLLVSCTEWGFDDPTELPPNETIEFHYVIG